MGLALLGPQGHHCPQGSVGLGAEQAGALGQVCGQGEAGEGRGWPESCTRSGDHGLVLAADPHWGDRDPLMWAPSPLASQ